MRTWILAAAVLAVAGGAPAHAGDRPCEVAPGKLLARWADTASLPTLDADAPRLPTDPALRRALLDAGVVRLSPLAAPPRDLPRDRALARPARLSRYVRLVLAHGVDPAAAAEHLRLARWFDSVETVSRCPLFGTTNDPSLTLQWYLRTTAGHDTHAREAWDVTMGDSTVVVGIADTGVDWQHPDLGGAAPFLNGSVYTNWVEAAGVPGVDDDADGYIDDVRGWDFVDGVTVWPGEDSIVADADPSDFNGHGTLVAGIVNALTNNATGIAGMGWKGRVLPLRVGFSGMNSQGFEVGYVDMDFAAEGITYAVDRGVVAVNCSWGSALTTFLSDAVDYAVASNVAIVVAAGNSNTEAQDSNWLSTRGDCIDVAATDSLDKKATFSSYGSWVDVSAPGLAIYSTYYAHTTGSHTYAYGGGTSFAAPCVCGALALLRSVRPTDTLAELRERLLASADPIDGINSVTYAGKIGWGRVNAAAAVTTNPARWEALTGGAIKTGLLVGDLPGYPGAVVSVSDGATVTALGADGATIPGWPQPCGSLPGPPALGVVGGAPAIVVAGSDSLVRAYRVNGASVPGWPRALGAAVRSGAAIGVIRATAPPAVIVGTDAGQLWAFAGDGSPLPGWPVTLGGPVRGTPSLGDMDGDGVTDIVVGTTDSSLYAFGGDGVALPGWPVKLTGTITSACAIGDVDHDGMLDVATVTSDGRVWTIDHLGVVRAGWPVSLGASTPTAPTLADLDGDQMLETIVALGSAVHVLHASDAEMSGWPAFTVGTAQSPPIVADVDGTGALAVLVGTSLGQVAAVATTALPVPGWPRIVGGAVRGAPVVGDAGADGVPDVVIGAADGWIVSVPLPGPARTAGALPWPMQGHDAARSSRVGADASTDARDAGGPHDAPAGRDVLAVRARSAHGTLEFRVSGAWSGDVSLALVDVSGRIVERWTLAAAQGDVLRARVPARVPAGVYMVRAHASGSGDATARVAILP